MSTEFAGLCGIGNLSKNLTPVCRATPDGKRAWASWPTSVSVSTVPTMPKPPNETPCKKPLVPSVKVRPGDFRELVEILKGRKPRPESRRRCKPIPVHRGRG